MPSVIDGNVIDEIIEKAERALRKNPYEKKYIDAMMNKLKNLPEKLVPILFKMYVSSLYCGKFNEYEWLLVFVHWHYGLPCCPSVLDLYAMYKFINNYDGGIRINSCDDCELTNDEMLYIICTRLECRTTVSDSVIKAILY